jgi:hypothetical protein
VNYCTLRIIISVMETIKKCYISVGLLACQPRFHDSETQPSRRPQIAAQVHQSPSMKCCIRLR